ncbi:MAG TPA: hypothetical protein VMT62_01765, partial [Syntrophorhabdaceae bacterium]|nr:hypothetical protein [Syntrophorhabdaceae bacterium]
TRPKRVIGDKAYDSDPARKRLKKRGINLLVPHRKTIATSIDRMTDYGIATGDDMQSSERSVGSQTTDASSLDMRIISICSWPSSSSRASW